MTVNGELFSEYECKVLERFRKPRVVNDEEQEVVDRRTGYGFFRFSFNWDELKEVCVLTNFGIDHLNRSYY
ncbi:MAG: hypothetical protein KAS32_03770 [Candidatus Peribacteraceae bacterium]|nr:hypothetical protein [Candidatus Peribacteraceae bacterium]